MARLLHIPLLFIAAEVDVLNGTTGTVIGQHVVKRGNVELAKVSVRSLIRVIDQKLDENSPLIPFFQ